MLRLLRLAIILATLLCTSLAHSQDKSVLYWPYFDLPPQFIVSNEGLSGMGIDVAQLIQKHIPDYEHKFIQANPRRIEEELRIDRDLFVVTGLLKTPERQKFALFSAIPCRITFSMVIVMRRQDRMKYAPKGKALLGRLLADADLTFGYIPGVHYGSFAKEVNAHTAVNPGNIFQATTIGQLIQLLKKKRIDWFVHDTLGIWHEAGVLGAQEDIAMVEAEKYPLKSIAGYIACPKTDAGKTLMDKIDRALSTLVQTGELRTSIKKWIPEQFSQEFVNSYSSYILRPPETAPD